MSKSQHEDDQEQLKNRDSHLAALKKSIGDVKAKLGQQKNLYETVRTDRNVYLKNLNESLEEIAEMKKKFRVMYHTIEQLKKERKKTSSCHRCTSTTTASATTAKKSARPSPRPRGRRSGYSRWWTSSALRSRSWSQQSRRRKLRGRTSKKNSK